MLHAYVLLKIALPVVFGLGFGAIVRAQVAEQERR